MAIDWNRERWNTPGTSYSLKNTVGCLVATRFAVRGHFFTCFGGWIFLRFGRPSPPYVPTLPCQICFISTATTAAISLRIYNHHVAILLWWRHFDFLCSYREKDDDESNNSHASSSSEEEDSDSEQSDTYFGNNSFEDAQRPAAADSLSLIVYRLQRRRTVIVMMNHLRGSSRGRRNILYTLHGSWTNPSEVCTSIST